MRDRVVKKLRDSGVTTITDGADGVSEPLTKAVQLAKRADIAVEIHFNAGPPTATGIECLAKPKHKALAQSLCKAINVATGLRLRGDGGYKPDNSGQHHRLAFCEAGGVVLEVCFISNAADMRAYNENFGRIADGLAAALISAAK